MISKETFVKSINAIKDSWDMADELNDIFRKHSRDDFSDGFSYVDPNLVDILITVLEEGMLDKARFVSWWCFDCNFGENSIVEDENGIQHTLDTPGELYNFLIQILVSSKGDES